MGISLLSPVKSLGEKLLNIGLATFAIIGSAVLVNLALSSMGILPVVEWHTFQLMSLRAFVFGVVLAPLWEELAFRYVPVTVAQKINKELVLPVIVLSSILFGWGHGMGPISLLIQGVGGFILSCLYIKNNNSYWSCVLVHALWNVIVYSFIA